MKYTKVKLYTYNIFIQILSISPFRPSRMACRTFYRHSVHAGVSLGNHSYRHLQGQKTTSAFPPRNDR